MIFIGLLVAIGITCFIINLNTKNSNSHSSSHQCSDNKNESDCSSDNLGCQWQENDMGGRGVCEDMETPSSPSPSSSRSQ
jgi:hypothetical protein